MTQQFLNGGQLFGPDDTDQPAEPIEEVGDRIEVWCRQFVNRWVFLEHQRSAALAELRELTSEVRKGWAVRELAK